MIQPEMLGLVLIPPKEFVFLRGRSFHLTSTLNAGLIAGVREGREIRRTVFFTPLNPWCTEKVERYCDDLTKPRKFHHKTEWKHNQNATH